MVQIIKGDLEIGQEHHHPGGGGRRGGVLHVSLPAQAHGHRQPRPRCRALVEPMTHDARQRDRQVPAQQAPPRNAATRDDRPGTGSPEQPASADLGSGSASEPRCGLRDELARSEVALSRSEGSRTAYKRRTTSMSATDLVLAMTGASGMPYGVRLLEMLLARGPHRPPGDQSRRRRGAASGDATARVRLDRFELADLLGDAAARRGAGQVIYHDYRDFQAGIASGSFLTAGMVICPCSMGTVGGDRARPVAEPDPSRRRRASQGAAQADPGAARDAAAPGAASQPDDLRRGRRRGAAGDAGVLHPAASRSTTWSISSSAASATSWAVAHALLLRWGETK